MPPPSKGESLSLLPIAIKWLIHFITNWIMHNSLFHFVRVKARAARGWRKNLGFWTLLNCMHVELCFPTFCWWHSRLLCTLRAFKCRCLILWLQTTWSNFRINLFLKSLELAHLVSFFSLPPCRTSMSVQGKKQFPTGCQALTVLAKALLFRTRI